MLVLSMPTKLWEYDWKVYRTDITKITFLQKGINFLSHCNLVHKFILTPQALKKKKLDAKAAVEKEWDKLEKIPAWQLTKSETKKRWSKKPRIRAEKFISRHWRISVISRIRSWSLNIKSTKAESYSEVTLWKMIQDLTQYLLNKDHLHSKWQPQKWWTIFLDYWEQQTQYPLTPRSKWKMHQRYRKFHSQNVQIFAYVYQSTNGPNHGPIWKTQLSSSWTESVRSSFGWTIVGTAIRESSIGTRLGKSSKLWMLIRQPKKKDYSHLCMWTILKCLLKSRTFYLGCTQMRKSNQQRYCE